MCSWFSQISVSMNADDDDLLFLRSRHLAPCWLHHPLTCSRWRHSRIPARVNLTALGLQHVNEFVAMCFRNNFTPHYCSGLMVVLPFFSLSNLHSDDSTCGIAGYSSRESRDLNLHQNSLNWFAPSSATRSPIQRWRQKDGKMVHSEPRSPFTSRGFKHEETFNWRGWNQFGLIPLAELTRAAGWNRDAGRRSRTARRAWCWSKKSNRKWVSVVTSVDE